MIRQMNSAELMAAKDARLVRVPAREHVADQAFFRRDLKLEKALLATILLFGPSRAIAQAQFGLAGQGARHCVLCVDFDRRGLPRFRADDHALASVSEVGADQGRHYEIETREDQ
jgi:hypothetical protein